MQRRVEKFSTGLQKYLSHPRVDYGIKGEVVWQDGAVSLIRMKPEGKPKASLLVVPSLINRAYIMDIYPGKGFLSHLKNSGVDVFVLDWGEPGINEAGFTISDYVQKLIIPALKISAEISGSKPIISGYCMGGNLAIAAAQLQPELCDRMLLLATPWDFHVPGFRMVMLESENMAFMSAWLEKMPVVSANFIQMMFACMDPLTGEKKFSRLAAESDEQRLADFVAIEDWVNDGIPMAPMVARECIVDWVARNSLQNGQWLVCGEIIQPQNINLEMMAVVPEYDRIVPKASSIPITSLDRCFVISPKLGHTSIMLPGAEAMSCWNQIAQWLTKGR